MPGVYLKRIGLLLKPNGYAVAWPLAAMGRAWTSVGIGCVSEVTSDVFSVAPTIGLCRLR